MIKIRAHTFFAICLVSFAGTLANDAQAWGKTGHRVVGAIAEHYLDENAKTAVREILNVESLAESSTWADFMRQNPDPFWQREAGPYHYVTIPDGKTYREVGPPPQGDAITALARFRKTLEDRNASLEQKQLALRFIVHIVGDLHQPLHAGNGTDRGGNDFRVVFFDEETNLHTVWDEKLIDREELSYTEWTRWLCDKITDQHYRDWQQTDPVVWVTESAELRQQVYPDNQFLRYEYPYQHIGTVKSRLQMAGVRLAAYLNEVFEP